MPVQSSALNLRPSATSTNNWRSRTLAVILMVAIAGIFWVDSRYPALLKRYHAGTQVKAAGALTFGTVYQVDRTMPISTRIWSTTVNWLDAKFSSNDCSRGMGTSPVSKFWPVNLAISNSLRMPSQ